MNEKMKRCLSCRFWRYIPNIDGICAVCKIKKGKEKMTYEFSLKVQGPTEMDVLAVSSQITELVANNIAGVAVESCLLEIEGETKVVSLEKINNLKYEAIESVNIPGEWRAEAIDHDNDGDCYVTIFSGQDANQRAVEYVTWKNSKN